MPKIPGKKAKGAVSTELPKRDATFRAAEFVGQVMTTVYNDLPWIDGSVDAFVLLVTSFIDFIGAIQLCLWH
jgi:hypothetical protein